MHPSRLVQERPAILLFVLLVRRFASEAGKHLQRARDRPLGVEGVQRIPAEQGAISRSTGAAAGAVLIGVEHHGLQAAPLEVRIAASDLLIIEA